ncbi:PTS transporter subunit EIIC [Thorsellia anophelis]|nr:PTS transporter subunit EIIC [Thorsellia anophelis]
MNILKYFQRIGGALMVPVAVLPAAAILLGVGYWIDADGWGSGNPLAALLIKSGAAIIDQMPMLFAIGIAFGLSKDKHGSAALTGFVSFMVVKTLCAPTVVSWIIGIPDVPSWQAVHNQVVSIILGMPLESLTNATIMLNGELHNILQPTPSHPNILAYNKIDNQFIGILVGVISSILYNRFSDVELPKALSFFNGKRLVPIIASFVMIGLSVILMYIWPTVFTALVSFGKAITSMGDIGAGIYAFFNRLLIPVGLHHALNAVFWFDVAGINDIPNFLGGAESIKNGVAVVGETGRYQAGFFPIMMFGLPAAALAIYQCAKPKNKSKIAGIMLAGAFASFFTGITEPLEFAFMFVAPPLYLLHAILTGISVYIASAMQWIAGFGFSAGLVDLALSSRNPLATQWYMLIPQGIVFAAIYYFSFRFAITKFNLMTPGRGNDSDSDNESSSTASVDVKQLAAEYLQVAGGFDNVIEIDACITRLRLTVKDNSIVQDAKACQLGAAAVVRPGQGSVQIVVGMRAEAIASAMKNLPR